MSVHFILRDVIVLNTLSSDSTRLSFGLRTETAICCCACRCRC